MSDDESGSTDVNPCGTVHALPCGLDVDCRVPVSYFDVDFDSVEIVERYESDNEETE